jgi:hypothetical protein
MGASETLAALESAETIARVYGDTETAGRLTELAAEVRAAEGEPAPICSICGGSVVVGPRVQCEACGFVFSNRRDP